MKPLTVISKSIEGLFGSAVKNKLKCYYRSFKYKAVRLRYKNRLIHYFFPDGIEIKSVDYFNENPDTLNKGYLKGYVPGHKDTLIDAGAFLGAFALYMGKKYPGIKIIAFEPMSENYNKLLKNIRLNKLNNVSVIKKGLWNKKDKADISIGEADSSIFSKGDGSEKIGLIDLDSELTRLKIKDVGLLKMDIEGAEIEALSGMKKSLKKISKFAIATYHIRDGKKTARWVEDFFKSNGLKARTGHSGQLLTWATHLN